MLLIDLIIVNKKEEVISIKKATKWSGYWVILALLFNIIIYLFYDPPEGMTNFQSAMQFATGYIIEKSLSIDNIFIFVFIFSYFKVPEEYQHRILFWGIFGALVFRLVFIIAGIALISRFDFMIYVLGAFLIITGIKIWVSNNSEVNPERNVVVIFIKKYFRILDGYQGKKFFVKINGKFFATTLFLVLVIIETTDIVFAMDSIPAILAVSKDTFIIYSSNAFAILGLRSLYFAVNGFIKLFHFISYGLSFILTFIGVKLILNHYSGRIIISTVITLIVIVFTLIITILLSYLIPKKKSKK